MKLLTPSQNKELKDQETLRAILRIQELQKIEKKARQDLANAQADFNLTLAHNREKWATEEQEHMERVKERKAEIDRLEAQRLNALIPVNILKASAEEQLADAEKYAKSLREKEETNELLAEKLQDKLDEVGEREQSLNHLKLELEIRQTGLENQSRSTILATQKLNEEMAAFGAYRTQAEKEIQAKLNEISIEEKSLEEKRQELATLQKKLNDQAIRLADERGVLDRAFQEVRRMKSNIPIAD